MVVTSENANARKPSNEIFDFALQNMKVQAGKTVMIGDNLSTDIAGAHASSIASIWLTESKEPAQSNCEKVIELSEITLLL